MLEWKLMFSLKNTLVDSCENISRFDPIHPQWPKKPVWLVSKTFAKKNPSFGPKFWKLLTTNNSNSQFFLAVKIWQFTVDSIIEKIFIKNSMQWFFFQFYFNLKKNFFFKTFFLWTFNYFFFIMTKRKKVPENLEIELKRSRFFWTSVDLQPDAEVHHRRLRRWSQGRQPRQEQECSHRAA